MVLASEQPYPESRSLAILFIIIFLAITLATVIELFISSFERLIHLNTIIWWAIFAICVIVMTYRFRRLILPLRNRLKTGMSWPLSAKLVNGLSWAGPFAMIPIFHTMYPYLVLLGIGAGNICTYKLLKRYNHESNRGQYLIGIISISFIPLLLIINYAILQNSTEEALLVSRLLVGIAYGIGGLYVLLLDH